MEGVTEAVSNTEALKPPAKKTEQETPQPKVEPESKDGDVRPEENSSQNEDAATINIKITPDSSLKDSPTQLTEEEKRILEELKARDREVRAHEQAHLNALGAYRRGGPSYTYETGPDGRQYAVGGEVPVDIGPAGTPEETIKKAQTVRRAALAPAQPSGQDQSVAARARQLEAQARAELAEERREETETVSTKGPKKIGENVLLNSQELEATKSDEETAEDAAEEANNISGSLVGNIAAFSANLESTEPCQLCGQVHSGTHTHIHAEA